MCFVHNCKSLLFIPSAPTGCGKTLVLELAILRLLIQDAKREGGVEGGDPSHRNPKCKLVYSRFTQVEFLGFVVICHCRLSNDLFYLQVYAIHWTFDALSGSNQISVLGAIWRLV